MSAAVYYLGRKQKIYGPLSAAEIQALRDNGQIDNYTWIWTPDAQQWTALDAAPTSPPLSVNVTPSEVTAPALPRPRAVPTAPAAASATPVPPPFKIQSVRITKASNDSFRAILFDGRNAVTAWVTEATADGCEIRGIEESPDPFFVHKASAIIMLHEVSTGRSTKMPVKVDEVFRRDQHWVYRVRWTSVPALFSAAQAA